MPCWTNDLFGIKNKCTSVRQEVLAGVIGWQAVVSSFTLAANRLVGEDEDVDEDATAEIFSFVAGLSTAVFAVLFNVPFIVAPSVLYTTREPRVSIGGHLAAQAMANLAATMFFALALRLDFVSTIPTALRHGAGCGISILVSVLGMRSVVGLATVTAACLTTSEGSRATKWAFVVGAPTVFTAMMYAVIDRSKFEGYSSAENPPLSSWGDGSFGALSFFELMEARYHQAFYVIRLFVSITLNVCSVLLVLIDAVCLEEMRTKLKSSDEFDFSNEIGGTKKFRLMACTIPLMSCLGNLLGATTQAAFVESMILVFVGGKTGLSATVTGVMLVLSTTLRPLLPVLSPGHVSGALTIVISLRFFSVIRQIDVKRSSNLLMFGVSILLIPFSSDFVDSLCIAAVLGFLCEVGNKLILRHGRRESSSRVAVSGGERTEIQLECEEECRKEVAVAQTGTEEGDAPYPLSRSGCPNSERRLVPLELEDPPRAPPKLLERRRTLANAKELRAFHRALPSRPSFRQRGLRFSSMSSRNSNSLPAGRRRPSHNLATATTPVDGPVVLHWGIALVAMTELVLSAIHNDQKNDAA